MCDYDVELCAEWFEETRTASERLTCDECWHPIFPGFPYYHAEGWDKPEWEWNGTDPKPDYIWHIHLDCRELKLHINNEHCGGEPFAIGELRDNVAEHYHDEPELLSKWAELLRTRRREAKHAKESEDLLAKEAGR